MSSVTKDDQIIDKPFAEALSERYLSYALSTIMSRSLPDVRDGLKPVHRRLLYAMRQLKLDPGSGFKKSARVVGDVMGKFHPHGDQAIYDALVRLAQEFSSRYPLVDGQGNFGNIDGDNAAAMRYTEARMTEVARLLLDGIDEDSVDFRPTYDGEDAEPIVLPAAFPNLLANGAAGIAVGMATSIPPHNVAEICDALLCLIDNSDASIEELTQHIQGPDFPTGGALIDEHQTIIDAYRTGRGSFRIRAVWEKEILKGGGYQIIVTEIPYQVQKSRLIERIADLLIQKKLTLLDDVRDESTDDIRLVLVPRSRNIDPDHLMETLFKQTDLENRFSLNMNVLDGQNTPRVMSLNEVLQAYLDHRQEVLLRRSAYRLAAIERRLEILAGYLVAYLNMDEVIQIIREADRPKQELIAKFDLTELQADSILNMRLRALNKLEEVEIQKEHDSLSEEKMDLEDLIATESRQWQVIKGQIQDLGRLFGRQTDIGRRHSLLSGPPKVIDIPVDVAIEKEMVTIICSRQGWIRVVRGHNVDAHDAKYKDGDGVGISLRAETTDKLIIAASNGRFYTLPVDKLPRGRGFGEPVRLLIDIEQDVDLITLFNVSPTQLQSETGVFLASSDGRGFRVLYKDIVAQTKGGRQVMALAEGAKLVNCHQLIDPETQKSYDQVAVCSQGRRLLVFALEDVSVLAKGRGVILQKYKSGDLLKDGLSDSLLAAPGSPVQWEHNGQVKLLKDTSPWQGKRAGQGSPVPRGFPKTNLFVPAKLDTQS